MLIYFAAPLFSAAEIRFNQHLTARLEAAGFDVFLPQRDGLEMTRLAEGDMTADERRAAIFALDTERVLACDIFLLVLDGRIPDEGACVELGIAYCQKRFHQPTKHLIGLQTDARAWMADSKLNPMLHGPLDELLDDEDALLDHLRRFAP